MKRLGVMATAHCLQSHVFVCVSFAGADSLRLSDRMRAAVGELRLLMVAVDFVDVDDRLLLSPFPGPYAVSTATISRRLGCFSADVLLVLGCGFALQICRSWLRFCMRWRRRRQQGRICLTRGGGTNVFSAH